MKELTTTSYALLGLLAIKAWSAYELTAQMKRSNIRLIWPRAESKLYEEPKNLVAHGLATAAAEKQGKRRRTVYRITTRGRAALRRWLKKPGAGLLLEFEGMLKVAYGDFASHAELLDNVRAVRKGMVRRSRLASALARELAEVGPRFPQRAHVNALVDRYVIDVMQATVRWAEWAEEVLERWPSSKLEPSIAKNVKQMLRENADALDELAARREDG